MVANEVLVYKEVPKGKPIPGQTTKKEQQEIDLDAPLEKGSILVRTIALSLDPYMRGRMRPAEIKSYVPSFEVGKPLENFAVVEVLRSENEKFSKGQKLYGYSKFQTYSVIPKAQADNLRVLENTEQLPWTTWVGSAGMPGQTAWYGLKFIGKPQKGETVFVSGAMGPVGQVTIALAHATGCKVIASAGSEEKVKYLREELKVERVFNYKTDNVNEVLASWNKEHGPFTVYVDNVGGEQLDAALAHIAPRGRIVAIGGISGYNGESYPIKNSMMVVGKELHWEGFIILNRMNEDLFREFYSEVPPALASGKFARPVEHVTRGLDNGEAFAALFDQENSNFGKAVYSLE
ncbi:alcohol dehydrogenase [Rhodotorula sp. JG-1b]|nr:alcohol dehydrogenase [Rhodotorula sp. JG-1b]